MENRLPKGRLASYYKGEKTSLIEFLKPLRECQLMAIANGEMDADMKEM